MKRRAESSLKQFVQWGRHGGRVRARRLAPSRRSAIAANAARARWRAPPSLSPSLPSVRLQETDWQDPVYLQEVLADGSLSDWRMLHRFIAERPFGATAQALERVLTAEKMYGVTPLWGALLRQVQG